MITKKLIKEFLTDYDFPLFDHAELEKTSPERWRFVGKVIVGNSSWHHTGSYFNRTDHYSMLEIAEAILENKDTLEEQYKEYVGSQKDAKAKQEFCFGFITVQMWGGTGKRPKLLGFEDAAGIIIGDWLYYKEGHDIDGDILRYKTTANKVVLLKKYDDYDALVKEHKKLSGTKRVFNRILKEKGILSEKEKED